MIGRLCLWILRKALEHDEMEFGRIIGRAYIDARRFAYASTIEGMQERIALHWGYAEGWEVAARNMSDRSRATSMTEHGK